jgi:ankyrin repeat protein
MPDKPYTQEEANQFIIDAHSDLETLKTKVAETPELVHAYNQETIESALGAAGHMARRDIAQFLLENGAQLELATAAMMGMLEHVREQLEADPSLALSGGAHNIPVAAHANMSDDPAMLQLLWEHGAEELLKSQIAWAIGFNKLKAVRWLLEHGADASTAEIMGKPAKEALTERGLDEMLALLAEFE